MEEHTSNGMRSSDHSAALAEKLLQGWALLQEHCPQCLTPLMRNRQRKMYCVACEQWVVSQSEAAEQIARERVEKNSVENSGEPTPSPLPLPEPYLVPVSSSHAITEGGQQEQIMDPDEPSAPSIGPIETLASQQDHRQSFNKETSSSALVIPKLEYFPKALEQVLPNVSRTLNHKLEEIGSALLASQNIDEIRLLLKVLEECFQTLEALRRL